MRCWSRLGCIAEAVYNRVARGGVYRAALRRKAPQSGAGQKVERRVVTQSPAFPHGGILCAMEPRFARATILL